MTEEAIIKIILDEAFYVHKNIGPGMLESVYKTCLALSAAKTGTKFGSGETCAGIF